ncbi:MAG: methionine--tRNA ligase [Patescibacteria group bacterium]|jgi:methionyl-tRNA synthetase
MSTKFYITTPIYYVNDKPHIGHAYTTIAADVLARYHRLKGDDVFFLTGTDEHGSKVAESAEKAGMDPQAFCDQNSALFEDAFKGLNISHDIFMRTTSDRHKKSVQMFMQKLFDKGDIYEGVYEGLYCTGCEKFLTEKELVNGMCPLHNRPPEQVKEKNYFFKLSTYLKNVRKLIETGKIVVGPESRKKETLGLFDQGLEDFSVSRERVTWGISLPWDSSQKTYVWVEALQNYISAIGYGDDQAAFEKWWPADVHLMAKDILKFHAIYWPALLLAAGLEVPNLIFAHGFFSLNGTKMSKSLGNVIDPNDLVKKYGVDATRFLLLSQFPFGQDGDIKESEFTTQFNAHLANGVGNLTARVATLIDQSGGVIEKNEYSELALATFAHIEKLAFHEALQGILDEVHKADDRLSKEKPWEKPTDDADRLKLLGEIAGVIMSIGHALAPFMPDISEKIISHFSQSKITKINPLFPRIT